MVRRWWGLWAMLLALAAAGPVEAHGQVAAKGPLDAIARDYLRLTLEAGAREPEYVDAYYGPPELKAEAEARPRTVAQLRAAAEALRRRTEAVDPARLSPIEQRRRSLSARPADGGPHSAGDGGGPAFRLCQRSRGVVRRAAGAAAARRLRRRAGDGRAAGAGRGDARRAGERLSRTLRHPARAAGRGDARRHRGVPPAHGRTHRAARRRDLHPGVRHRQAVERLQLLQGIATPA